MGGLPDGLRQELYAALLATPYFASYSALLPLFIDERLYPWRAGLPQRDTPAGLTQAAIDYLYPLYHQQHGSALLALLQVIHTTLPEGDAARSRLATLIERARPGLTTPPTPEHPMSQPYNLAVVRQLLAAAFSAGEISTLAFDLFPAVYHDFAAGMTRAQKIEMVLAYAERTGGVDDLLAYVQRVNRYQYNRFAARLRPDQLPAGPQKVEPMPDFNAQRQRDLLEHIERERDLLKRYEEQLRYETEPRRVDGIQANIKRQKEALAGYLQEAATLGLDVEPVKPVAPPPLPKPEDDLPPYVAREQAWFPAGFPTLTTLTPEQVEKLKPEIDVVIMVATEVEFRAALHILQHYPRRKNILRAFVGPETYFLGKFGAYRAAVTRCGMGSGGERGSTLATPDALRIWQPQAIIMPGIAFGKDPNKQQMADVLVASQIIPYEKQRVGRETIFRDPIPPSNAALLNRFENALDWQFTRPDGQPCKLHVGPVLSGEKLVDNLDFKAFLFQRFPEAVGGEMEGAGLAAAAGRLGVPWILVKAICDWGDGAKHGKHQPLAAAASVDLVHHVLSHKGVLPGRRS